LLLGFGFDLLLGFELGVELRDENKSVLGLLLRELTSLGWDTALDFDIKSRDDDPSIDYRKVEGNPGLVLHHTVRDGLAGITALSKHDSAVVEELETHPASLDEHTNLLVVRRRCLEDSATK
jgi:hypothetical protein